MPGSRGWFFCPPKDHRLSSTCADGGKPAATLMKKPVFSLSLSLTVSTYPVNDIDLDAPLKNTGLEASGQPRDPEDMKLPASQKAPEQGVRSYWSVAILSKEKRSCGVRKSTEQFLGLVGPKFSSNYCPQYSHFV